MTKGQPTRVLVTGAGSGIGKATVRRLLENDDTFVIALDRSDELLADVEQELDSPDLITCKYDLKRSEDIPAFVRALVREHGPVTNLVNNAGTWLVKPIVETDEEIWDLIFAVNVKAPFLLTRELAPVMASANGGAIVNIVSRNAFRSSTCNAAYDASKAALLAFTRTAAGELAADGIRVNAVCPGMIRTPPNESLVDNKTFHGAYCKLIPMNRFGLPEEVAGVVAFALSDEASYMTGESMIVDGGQIACQDNKRFMEIPGMAARESTVTKQP
jgi:NAD(P)-dependent dehydrogenase (short-subunit alcohol dehydrogenase family)